MVRDVSKIVIVEDEGIVAKDMEKMLQKIGYKVCGIVSTGESALSNIAMAQPDLVLNVSAFR